MMSLYSHISGYVNTILFLGFFTRTKIKTTSVIKIFLAYGFFSFCSVSRFMLVNYVKYSQEIRRFLRSKMNLYIQSLVVNVNARMQKQNLLRDFRFEHFDLHQNYTKYNCTIAKSVATADCLHFPSMHSKRDFLQSNARRAG